MNRKKYSVVILAIALIIIGTREVCMAQFSQRAAIDKSDTQEWNDVQLAIPVNKSTDVLLFGTLRLGRNITHPVDERIGGGFVFRVKRYVYVSPTYQYGGMQPAAGRKSYESRLSLATTLRLPFEKFTISDRNLFERRFRHPPVDATRYRNRLQIEHPINLAGLRLQGFVSDEVFYDFSLHRWVRNRFAVGVSRRFNRQISEDFYFLRQNDGVARPGDLNVIGTTLRVRL
jgi:hypothetical protein